jgi:hypothetical protein
MDGAAGEVPEIGVREVTKMEKITKSVAVKMLGDVPGENWFWCYDGRVLKNLQELETALKEMGEETFRYHASEAKNDFSNWVKDVIGDEKLSGDLRKSTTGAQAAKKVADRIAWLKKKLAGG